MLGLGSFSAWGRFLCGVTWRSRARRLGLERQGAPIKCENHRNQNPNHLHSHTWICFFKQSPQTFSQLLLGVVVGDKVY